MKHFEDIDQRILRSLAWTFMASSLLLVLISGLN